MAWTCSSGAAAPDLQVRGTGPYDVGRMVAAQGAGRRPNGKTVMKRIPMTRTAARALAFLLVAAAPAQAQISFDQQTLTPSEVSYQRQIGDLDAVTRIGDSGTVNGEVVWLENPRPDADVTGTWTVHAIGDADNVKDIVTADFDGDGTPDVAAREHTVSRIWLQDGGGAWSARAVPHVGNEGLDVGDLDGDGDPDLVLNGFWLETPADPRSGSFTEHVIDDRWFTGQDGTWQVNSSKVVVADIDRDGGDAWTPVTLQSSGSYSAEIGDLQGDGDPDIADVRNYDQAPTEIRLNQVDRPVGVDEFPRRRGAVRAAPNPFNPSTEIRFTTPAAGDVSVRIHDARGRMLRTLTAGRRDAGDHAVRWDGRDARGRPLPSGAYRAVVVHPGGAATCGLSLVR